MASNQQELLAEPASEGIADASVIILAFTAERWALTCAAVESTFSQTLLPREVVLCVEGNPELAERFRERWRERAGSVPSITIVESPQEPVSEADDREQRSYGCHGSRIGAERTRGVSLASGEIAVFLDDDASADPDWLARLLDPFSDPAVVGVGGAPLPVYAKPRPRWFPFEFDWIFGCAYEGLPKKRAPIKRLIGANMAARREAVLAVGGFRSLAEDLDMANRLLELSPQSTLIYEPAAIVHHYVNAERLTWHYFWRRCFWAGRGKVSVMRGLGEAANMSADRQFVARSLSLGIARGLGDFVKGDVGGLERAVSIVIGLTLSALAYATGTVEWKLAAWRGRESPSAP